MKLRDYQDAAVAAIWNYFATGGKGHPVVAMPTGTGKSLVIARFIQSIYEHYPNQRVMMVTHVKELIEQNFEKLTILWPNAPAGIYSSGLNRKEAYNSVTYAGIGSVAKKHAMFGHIDLILIDEAHLVSPNDATQYRTFIDALTEYNPNLKVIGFTATPYRVGQGMITDEGGLFTDICFDLTSMESFNRLIAEGYLSNLVPKKTELVLNTDGVGTRGGEYISKQLQTAVDKNEITEAAVRETMEHAHDRNCWLVFTAGVEHAIHTAEILNQFGITAKAVHGNTKQYKMTDADRDQTIADFKAGKFQALVNNNVLTTGFDHPRIDLILCLRPTGSVGLWVQILGRGTRVLYADGFDLSTIEGRLQAIANSDKPDCLVMDFGNNIQKLGPINDPRIPKAKGKKGGEAPIKECEAINHLGKKCNTWIHASLRFCPHCGNEFIFKNKLRDQAGVDDIIKSDLPVNEEFPVDHITFSSHNKANASPSLKVTYYAGKRNFAEYICFEHEGFALRKAKTWWKERSHMEPPTTIAQALELVELISAPTHLRVWTNKKYPQIMGYCFDGTCFGSTAPSKAVPTVDTEKVHRVDFTKVKGVTTHMAPSTPVEDDDIPF